MTYNLDPKSQTQRSLLPHCPAAWPQARTDPKFRVRLIRFVFLFYFLNISCRGPGRYLRTVSRMLSSSSSSSPQPLGIAFFGRVSDPSHACSMAAFSSASFSSFFFKPYWQAEKQVVGRGGQRKLILTLFKSFCSPHSLCKRIQLYLIFSFGITINYKRLVGNLKKELHSRKA